jgi:uncharacterized membrane protein YkvA (DUF1232 family)
LLLSEVLKMNWRETSSSARGPRWLLDLIKNLRLAWRLFRDPELPSGFRLIPVVALLYLLFPVDFLPDVVPGLGQADDLTVLLLGLKLFLDTCPPAMVEKHLARMTSVEASYRVVDEESSTAERTPAQLEASTSEDTADASAVGTEEPAK